MNDFLQSLRNGQAEKPRTPKTRKNYDNSYHYNSGPRFHSYGGGGYQNTRNPQMKRQPTPGLSPQQPTHHQQQAPADDQLTLLADVLDNLTNQVDTLVKNQEYMITVQERQADLLQRQADAIEMVLGHLNIGPDMTPAPSFENHYVSSQEPEEDFAPVEKEETVEELLKAELAEEKVKGTVQAPAKPVLRKRRKVVSPKPAAQPQQQPQGNADLLPREEIMDIIDSMRKEGATYDQVAKRLIDLGQPTFSGRGEWHAQTIHRLCSKK
ncbi:MAG: hypothetical protein MI863_13420 [Desulfobacterales bacterium]|nr:hypothetical protein [Desulfobacterales bacterium]